MKVCKANSRAAMCSRVRKEVDSRTEMMAKITAAYGTGAANDPKTKKEYRARLSALSREIREIAPEYYKLIRQND